LLDVAHNENKREKKEEVKRSQARDNETPNMHPKSPVSRSRKKALDLGDQIFKP